MWCSVFLKASSAFLPIHKTETLESLYSLRIRLQVFLTTLLLKAPAKPRLEEITINNTFFPSVLRAYLFSEVFKLALKFCKIEVSFSAYGRICVMASCARFSFAALTIFMADVICIVEPTDVI